MACHHWSDALNRSVSRERSRRSPRVPSLQGILTANTLPDICGAERAYCSERCRRARTPRRLAHLKVLILVAECNKHAAGALTLTLRRQTRLHPTSALAGASQNSKIAVRSHQNSQRPPSSWALFGTALSTGKVVFCGLPLFHVDAQIGTGLTVWAQGGHVILGTPQGYLSSGNFRSSGILLPTIKLLRFRRAHRLFISHASDQAGSRPFSTIEYGICGAAPMPTSYLIAFSARRE